MTEKTDVTSQEYINTLVKDHYQDNNHVIPFAKIDDGFIQTIKNPHEPNGFIAMQILTPRYRADNTVFHITADATELELETDEARRFQYRNADKMQKGDIEAQKK